VLALLFNCSEPESITLTLEKIQSDDNVSNLLHKSCIVLGAYANRLTTVDPNWTLAGSDGPQQEREDLDEKQYCDGFVRRWVEDLGVQLIGGCCGITPNHISYLARHVGASISF
jgi:homocysteine S-methyltransferase